MESILLPTLLFAEIIEYRLSHNCILVVEGGSVVGHPDGYSDWQARR